MANTLKFGNGQWATKVGSTLAYNDENGNFKPLPFNFTRSTSATRVNKDGLIEVVTNNKPRIDFLNDSNGALLLEPSRTNYVLLSNDFSGLSGGFVTPNYGTSPQGLSVSRVLFTAANQVLGGTTSLSTGVVCNFSAYVKGVQGELIRFAAGGADVSHTFSGEWERLSGSKTSVNNSWNFNTYGIATARDFLICGAQLELGSYATSYIPTQGATATRVADACSKTGVSSLIGQTEGTIYLEANIQKRNEADFYVAISDGATLGDAIYAYQPSSGTLTVLIRKTGNPSDGVINVTTSNWTAGLNKLAIAYTSTTAEAFINGVSKGTTSFASLPAFTKLTIGSRPDSVGTLVGSGGYNQALLFNTRLTDAECIELTTI
jgi:hypothetical protein